MRASLIPVVSLMCVCVSACSSSSGGGGSSGSGGAGGGGASSSASTGSGASPQGTAIDCSWFAQPDNCWATTIAAATACAPPGVITDDPSIPNNVGAFSADRLSCAYDDGTSVTFDAPVPDPTSGEMFPFGDYVWTFDVKTPDGASCVRRDEGDRDFVVYLASGEFRLSYNGTPSDLFAQITCPDGSQFHMSAVDLSACEGVSPTSGFFSAGNFVTYELYGGGFDEQQLFLCK